MKSKLKYLITLFLGVLLFYGYIVYAFEKKNSHYQELCTQNLNNEKRLFFILEEWNNWFNEQKLYVDRNAYELSSLRYSIFLTFMNKEHENRLVIYRSIRDKNVIMSEVNRMVFNAEVEASFLMIELNEFPNTSLKRESVCSMYQKYILDVAVSPLGRLSKYDKYCDGLTVDKKFTNEKIKEDQEVNKLYELL